MAIFWKAVFFLLALLVFAGNSTLQAVDYPYDDDDLPSFHTPYHTIATHFHFTEEGAEHHNPAISGRALSAPGEYRGQEPELAQKLKHIYRGFGLLIHWEDLPRESDYIDTASGESLFIPFRNYPDIYLEKYNGQWKFSRETTGKISDIYYRIYPLGLDQFIQNLPDTYFVKFWGIYLWQYFGILILAFLGIAVHKLLSWVLGYLLIMIIARLGYREIAINHVPPVSRPMSIWLLVLFLLNFLPALQLPPELGRFVIQGLYILAHLMVIVVLYRSVDVFGATYKILQKSAQTSLEQQLRPLLQRIIKIFIVIIGTLFILQNFDFEITTLLAGLSLGGLAFALAAQDTVKNLFGSLLIFSDKPFKVGDWISFNDMDGNVEEVGLRSTRVRTFYNSLIYIPNGRLADMAVDNYGERKYRRFFTKISITYDTPPVLIEKFVEGLKKIVDEHPTTRKDVYHIYLNDYNSSSLDIIFYIFFEVPDWGAELKGRHEVMLSSIRLANELGVRFAFPTQTIHMEEFPGQGSNTPEYEKDPEKIEEKMKTFFSQGKGNNS